MKPAFAAQQLGQSIWLDNIDRGQLMSGAFRALVEEDGVTGVTSNPTIFEKAITGSADYDAGLRALIGEGADPGVIFEALAVADLGDAADVLRPIYDRTGGADGFVSIEVSPTLAHDTEGTIVEARRLWSALRRPNVMVKIPGTREGLPAIEQCLSEGININITLLFSVDRYGEVVDRYFAALERRVAANQPIDRIASVASFFVSRVDTAVDKIIDARLGETSDSKERDRLQAVRGAIAIANAKRAYALFKTRFSGDRWQQLEAAGARFQRPLWASTSTKDPAYPDVYYVEALIGPHTVDTLPPQTLVAFNDHGTVALTLEDGLAEAEERLTELAALGIDLDEVTARLEREGVDSFAKSFESLMSGIAAKRDQILGERDGRQSAALGPLKSPVAESMFELQGMHFARRLWDRDGSLWSKDPDQQKSIDNRLGWLNSFETMRAEVDSLTEFAGELRANGFTDVVLMGMGGSSLAPEVLRDAFGAESDTPSLHVLDSTDPLAVTAVEKVIDLDHTLFIASSKSGTTTETMAFLEYFWAKRENGAQFAVITDPGSTLDRLGKELSFRRVFLNQPDIGGRYSAVSFVGMVPAAILGVDLPRLLDRVSAMAAACGPDVPIEANAGVCLGAIIGRAARDGRDKLTLICAPGIASFGYWVEQLIAESTGKQGKGIIPIEGEPVGAPAVYGDDRLFVYLTLAEEPDDHQDAAVAALERAGFPVVRITLRDRYDLGGEFFRWELATATAGALLGVNPFDEPNVQESKDNTRRVLREYEQRGAFPDERPLFDDGLTLYAATPTANGLRRTADSAAALCRFVKECEPGDYLAITAYLPRTEEIDAALREIRRHLRDTLKVATTVGYGPRFLHSTGQLHKGGPARGVFLQLTHDITTNLPVPGAPYSFGVLERAQALGDLQSLQSRKLRAVRVSLGADIAAGLERLKAALIG
ncbi:MAG: bifunctional transaldolase/phosoglucose isomerase [Dehalococcoidia bacterium]